MEKIKLMSHLVAGYATDEISLEVARSLVKGGADILEIPGHIHGAGPGHPDEDRDRGDADRRHRNHLY